MSAKHLRKRVDAKREKRRPKRPNLPREGRSPTRIEIPAGAVASDVSKLVPNNSYSPPPLFYRDKEFTCADCGREDVWTARQQKWYYEVAKGSLYASAVRCRNCRRVRSERQNGRGDPNPIKHIGTLLKRIHNQIAPRLEEAGFNYSVNGTGLRSNPARLEYSRSGTILQCLLDPLAGVLIAETLDANAEYRIVARVELGGNHSSPALIERVDEFALAIDQFLRNLPPS